MPASEHTRVYGKIKSFNIVNKCLSYVFSEKPDWDIMGEQDTKHRCIVWTWTTDHASGSDMSNELKTEESPEMICMESSLLVRAFLTPLLRYQDVCKQNRNIDLVKWE